MGLNFKMTLKKWMTDQRKSGRSVSAKMIINETRRLTEQKIQSFTGLVDWCYWLMKRQRLSMLAKTAITQQILTGYEEKVFFQNMPC